MKLIQLENSWKRHKTKKKINITAILPPRGDLLPSHSEDRISVLDLCIGIQSKCVCVCIDKSKQTAQQFCNLLSNNAVKIIFL